MGDGDGHGSGASPGRPSLSARPAPNIGPRPASKLGLHARRGALAGCPFWGLAPLARHEHPCNRARVIPPRCLIVDDNTSFREEMRALLLEQGLDVVGGAGTVADAHRRIAELRPDVALIDIDLGGESGLELARQLRQEPTGAAAPHVILISTHDEAEYADLIQASSAIGFLAKNDLSAASIRRMLAAIEGGEATTP